MRIYISFPFEDGGSCVPGSVGGTVATLNPGEGKAGKPAFPSPVGGGERGFSHFAAGAGKPGLLNP